MEKHLRKEEGEVVGMLEGERERASTCTESFVLMVFICFLRGVILGEVSGEPQ